MAEIYCHSKTLLNALRAVWLEAGKTLFGQAATGAQDAGGVDAGGGAAARDNGGAVRWKSRAAGWCRLCPQEVTGLLDGVVTICQRLRSQAVSMSSARKAARRHSARTGFAF